MNIYLHIFLYDVYLSINYILILFIIFQVPFAQRLPYSSLQHNISLKNIYIYIYVIEFSGDCRVVVLRRFVLHLLVSWEAAAKKKANTARKVGGL